MTSGAAMAMGRYLSRCRMRLAWFARVRIAVAGITVVGVLTAAFAAAAARWVPSEGWIIAARILLYAMCAATLLAAVFHRIDMRRAAHRVERRVPDFDGRLVTWLDASRQPRRPALLPHLAEHALGIANANPPRRAAPGWLLLPPFAVLTAVALALYLGVERVPASWRLPAERLWTGDLLADTRPKIIVEPGAAVVPRGADVLIRAEARGFSVDTLFVNASFAGSTRWERAAMMPSSDNGSYDFVLVAVNEAVDYYVGTGGTRAAQLNSDRFRIEVADLPVIEGVELVLDYPAWTRLPSATQDRGDVTGVEGTRVGVQIRASLPLDDARLIVNDEEHDLDDGTGEFTIRSPGTWHVAVRHRGRIVRISDEYLIDLAHDQPPAVEFTFPGRDRSATAIEEVVLRFRAKDDFGIESLELRYAVNGSDWSSVEGDSRRADREADGSRTLLLEDLAVGEEQRPVRPGDVVSVHAVAHDHRQSTKTALYFIDVRAFDRHYRDLGAGSSGNGGGGPREQELSNRQREVLNATWNLIQERDTGARAGNDLRDQVDLVAVLQRTLKEQVETLIARTEGRRLADNDEVEPYVDELAHAAEQMEIAAATLAGHGLDDAVQPEQRALQHLLTAEAGLRNVNVTLSSSAAGDSVSRSLAELFDLEADPEQNRYEAPQTPGGISEQRTAEAEWQRLTELARRNEELARAHEQPNGPEAPLSRWQLERLQREIEDLRDRLADNSVRRPEHANRRHASGTQSDSNAAPRSAPGRTPSGGNPPPEIRGTIKDLDRARAAIEWSLSDDNASRGSQDTAEAFRQGADALKQAADRILKDRRDALTATLRNSERQANALVQVQERILTRLEALAQETLEAVRQGRAYFYRSGDFEDEAETKRRMRKDVERIAADMANVRQQLAATDDGANVIPLLDRALDDLADSRVADQLTMAADAFEMGRPLFMTGRERRVHDALNRLSNRLGHAVDRREKNAADATPASAVAEVQALRRQLNALGAGGNPRALREIAAATWELAEQVLAPEGRLDLAETRRTYRGWGAGEANRERLFRLMLAELDQMEIVLRKVDGTPVRAEEREEGYDSEAVAEYFRHLSSGG